MVIKHKRLPTDEGALGDFIEIELDAGEAVEWIPPAPDSPGAAGSILLGWQTAGSLGGELLAMLKAIENAKA
ncbi:MAG: hypothetical protein F4X64_00220 [Chloroflexi bacterium]|nr:hypothetical protein [Chloroflexota bacterium]